MTELRNVKRELSRVAALTEAHELRIEGQMDTIGEQQETIEEQAKTIRELEFVIKGYEDNLGEPLRQVKEDVEREWSVRLDREVKVREEKEAWADVLVKQLEKEKKVCGHTRIPYGCAIECFSL